LGEEKDVAAARTEGRHVDADDVDAVEEVLAEALFLDLGLEVAVGGGDDAGVEGLLLVPADGSNGALLERAQELGLHSGGHLADLVEEEGAPAGLDEEPRTSGARVGE